MPDALRPSSIASNIVVANSFTPTSGAEEKFHKWYEEDYIPVLRQVAGWARTRRYKLEDRGLTGLKVSEATKELPGFLEISGTSQLAFSAIQLLSNSS